MSFNRLKALLILSECTGDDIWSPEHCRLRGVPEEWLEHLTDSFESGFDRDSHTIYVAGQVVNQYHGLRDVDLAIKLGEYLGIDVEALKMNASTRRQLVRLIRESVEEA
jgi:hypothetical protein